MVALVFLNFAVWLVQKARATFLTNQFKTWTNCDLVIRVFPPFMQYAHNDHNNNVMQSFDFHF